MKSFLNTLSPLLKKGTTLVLICTIALAALVTVVHMVMVAAFPYSIDYGEGPLLDQAVRIHEGEPLYSDSITEPPYTITNYPPVFVGVLSLFNSRESASLLPGRILSALSTLGTAFLISQIVYFNNKDRFAALTAAVLFLIFPFVFQWGGTMRVDNLALLFATAALYSLLRWRTQKWVLFLVATLLTLAAYTRQSYLLAAPFACGVYLLFKDRKRAFQLAGITLVLVGGLFAIFMAATRGGFWEHIGVANQNFFRWETVEWYFRDQFGDPFLILSLISLVFLAVGWKHIDQWKLAAPFLLGATASAITVGKIGSSVNYLLELVAAMAIALGLFFSWLRMQEKPTAPWLNPPVVHGLILSAFTLLTVAQMRTMLEIDLLEQTRNVNNRFAQQEELDQLNALIGSVPGRVLLTEQMHLLALNGKSIYLQPFEMTQLFYDGTWNQNNFLYEIEHQQFDLILFHQWDGERWTDAMRKTIWHNYAAAYFLADTVVYTPVGEEQAGNAVLNCHPESGWITPTNGAMGAFWYTRQAFIASGMPWGTAPVFAAADGLLYRFPGWKGAVAIQHEDPLNQGNFVWSYYGSMRSPWNENEEYILEKFPPSFKGVPVRKGNLIGYQGAIELPGADLTSRLHFAVIPADADGFFPVEWWDLPTNPDAYQPDLESEDALAIKNTGEYLGINASTSSGQYVYWYPYRCTTHQEGK